MADSSRILSVNFESLFVNHQRRFEVREAALLMMMNSKGKKTAPRLGRSAVFCCQGLSLKSTRYEALQYHTLKADLLLFHIAVVGFLQLCPILVLTLRDTESIAKSGGFTVGNLHDGEWAKATIVSIG